MTLFINTSTGLPFWAKRSIFAGGGYVANLGNNEADALSLLDDLIRFKWLDRYSRALMIEFNVLNANTNLFKYVLVCVEFSIEGSYLLTVDIGTVVLYRFVFLILYVAYMFCL